MVFYIFVRRTRNPPIGFSVKVSPQYRDDMLLSVCIDYTYVLTVRAEAVYILKLLETEWTALGIGG